MLDLKDAAPQYLIGAQYKAHSKEYTPFAYSSLETRPKNIFKRNCNGANL
jgi:hypothetical protein